MPRSLPRLRASRRCPTIRGSRSAPSRWRTATSRRKPDPGSAALCSRRCWRRIWSCSAGRSSPARASRSRWRRVARLLSPSGARATSARRCPPATRRRAPAICCARGAARCGRRSALRATCCAGAIRSRRRGCTRWPRSAGDRRCATRAPRSCGSAPATRWRWPGAPSQRTQPCSGRWRAAHRRRASGRSWRRRSGSRADSIRCWPRLRARARQAPIR